MKKPLIAAILAGGFLFGPARLGATSLAPISTSLRSAEILAVDLWFVTASDVDGLGAGLFDGGEADELAVREAVTSVVREAARDAGLEFDATEDWAEQARYTDSSPPRPHHTLRISVSGRAAPDLQIGEMPYVFLVEIQLVAEFVAEEVESFDLEEGSVLGTAMRSRLQEELIRVIASEVEDMVPDWGTGSSPGQITLVSDDGKVSVEVTQPGYKDLRAELRGELEDATAKARIFSEPRRRGARPLAEISLPNKSLPAAMTLGKSGEYLAILHNGWTSPGAVVGSVYRRDGSLV
ncbi:MAG: hypothetical protein KDD47_11480, partial [Acidobacteria bacterium]|nr:hypothetical protein [Acidobacteriota bacterium]